MQERTTYCVLLLAAYDLISICLLLNVSFVHSSTSVGTRGEENGMTAKPGIFFCLEVGHKSECVKYII